MKTRLVAIVGAAAVALAIVGIALLALAYTGAISPPDDSGAYVPGIRDAAAAQSIETPAPTAEAAEHVLPTVADIPEGLSPDEYAHAVEWLTWSGLIDECMADAGFPEWYYESYWQRDLGSPGDWSDAFDDPDRLAAAAFALGGNPGAGADYRWQDAGCQGAATETLGITS